VLLLVSGLLVARDLFRYQDESDGLSARFLDACMAYFRMDSNQMVEEILAPRLLDDRGEERAYLQAFPYEDYTTVKVSGVGSFHLGSPKDHIKDVLRQGIVWEASVVHMISKYVRFGSQVVDAGAHIGAHTLVMANLVGPNGRVFAFEPRKKLHRELHHNAKLNGYENIVALRYALGDTNAVIEMDAVVDENEGGTHVGSGGDAAELRTIDSFFLQNVSLIKIDVEHFEDPVLEGARNTIAYNRLFIIVEIQGGYNYDNVPEEIREKILHTIGKIESMGYRVTRFGTYDYLGIPRGEAG
tara:strand:- start:120 stop:1016 length:897 start_codon:yes stop_codon:yes gene_type:complete